MLVDRDIAIGDDDDKVGDGDKDGDDVDDMHTRDERIAIGDDGREDGDDGDGITVGERGGEERIGNGWDDEEAGNDDWDDDDDVDDDGMDGCMIGKE
jgi:hypothetical protein